MNTIVEFPDASYNTVTETLTWNGQLYAPRPVDETHPYFDVVRSNPFTERTPPSDEEVRQRAIQDLEQARQAFAAAAAPELTPEQRRELLERTVRLSERIITVWASQSGLDQTDAVQLREQAVAALEAMTVPAPGAPVTP